MTDDVYIVIHFADGTEKKLNGKYPFMVFIENSIRSIHRGSCKMWQPIKKGYIQENKDLFFIKKTHRALFLRCRQEVGNGED